MTTDMLRRIFRFRERMDRLTSQITCAESSNSSAQSVRVERAALNLTMMLDYGVCMDLSKNEPVAFEDAPTVATWLSSLARVLTFEMSIHLQEVLRDG